MLLPLPNLDDRRWTDLVEEGRALIPVYDRAWSDHNIHDPGIMLVELFAWLAEMDIYWLNRIPESHTRKFLALAGTRPAGPRAAQAVLQVLLRDGSGDTYDLPSGVHFEGQDPQGQAVPFRTLHPVTLVPGALQAVQVHDGQQWSSLTALFGHGAPFAPFGGDPRPGTAFYLGFSRPLPVGRPVSLYFSLPGDGSGYATRLALAEEYLRGKQTCRPSKGLVDCPPSGEQDAKSEEPDPNSYLDIPFRHHCARLRWEYRDPDEWRTLNPVPMSRPAKDPAPGQVHDGTRAFTLDGRVVVNVPGAMGRLQVGQVPESMYWLRCTLESGSFDETPWVASVAFNGVRVEQATGDGVQLWIIHAGAEVVGPEPQPGDVTGFRPRFDNSGWIERLEFDPDGPPQLRVLHYRRPEADQPGRLGVEAEALKPGDDRPFQVRTLAQAPVQAESLSLHTWEQGRWVAWHLSDDMDAAGRADAGLVLDATTGDLRFGDGDRGSAFPAGAQALVSYRATRAEGGNLRAGSIRALPESLQNRALVSNLGTLLEHIAGIDNLLPAAGGAPAETIDAAAARLLAELSRRGRAVTLQDIEWLARQTPGLRLARAHAIPNVHPDYPCMKAPGVITLVVLPYLPLNRPVPCPGLLQAVRSYLTSRRVIGTRIVVVGPRYVTVSVRARLQARGGVAPEDVQSRAIEALNTFLHPLVGGPDGDGWPFGRDVYRSEILQVLDEVPGADHVLSLELVDEDGQPQCSNFCLGPLGLVDAGEHRIEVV
jgi:hypothetical protein